MAMIPLTSDESAILMLCATLGRGASCPRPLTGIAYDRLATWLRDRGSRPGNLLEDSTGLIADLGESDLAEVVPTLTQLLLGQLALSLRLESWSRVGGWVVTRASVDYPRRLNRLGAKRPPVLFGLGSRSLLGKPGIAIVGSRDAPGGDLEFAAGLGASAARDGYAVVSGAARGVDWSGMSGALDVEGTAIGVVSDRLSDVPTVSTWRKALMAGSLCMVSAVDPESRFTTGNAMSRNKVIYGLADRAIVVRSAHGSGGTWAGAVEAIRLGVCPVHVRAHPDGEAKQAAEALCRQGGLLLPDLAGADSLKVMLGEQGLPDVPDIRTTLWD
jgi:predicted Rossmann fold nucleotide-binding protein DprA/Smf involved in DNA uptake